ncbi:MAG: hypothetical protein ACRD3M_15380 [Thermoanaerobaculia bacterium]
MHAQLHPLTYPSPRGGGEGIGAYSLSLWERVGMKVYLEDGKRRIDSQR